MIKVLASEHIANFCFLSQNTDFVCDTTKLLLSEDFETANRLVSQIYSETDILLIHSLMTVFFSENSRQPIDLDSLRNI